MTNVNLHPQSNPNQQMAISTEEKLDVINCLLKSEGIANTWLCFWFSKSTVHTMLNN
jgi:hypothetical protein